MHRPAWPPRRPISFSRSATAEPFERLTKGATTLKNVPEPRQTLQNKPGMALFAVGNSEVTQSAPPNCSTSTITLNLRGSWAQAIYMDSGASDEERVDAVATCEDCVRISLRVMGPTHPKHLNFQDDLRRARAVLALARGEIDGDAFKEAWDMRKNVGRISIAC